MSAPGQEAFLYDTVPYPDFAHQQTHPSLTGAIARLHGLRPAPPDRASVLELGCGSGSNLIPMACDFPGSRFVGVDLSRRSIEAGLARKEALGLTNLDLRHGSIMEVEASWGRFDYIISHGVFSWVPDPVRERLLGVCRDNLAEQGVAYLSYNAHPGGHLRQMVRSMMRFHTRSLADPAEKSAQGLMLLQFLAQSQPEPDLYQNLLQYELKQIAKYHPGQLLHDDLAETNRPYYFTEFMEQALAAGLQFLAEADYFESSEQVFSRETQQVLERMGGDRITREQYLDFLKCRRFRQTLLCRGEAPIHPVARAEALSEMWISSRLAPDPPEASPASPGLLAFKGRKASRVETDFGLAKAALCRLHETAPAALPFQELVGGAWSRFPSLRPAGPEAGEAEKAKLADLLLKLFSSDMVQLHLRPPALRWEAGDRPSASRLARYEAARGELVTNQRHTHVQIGDPIALELIRLMDGTRTAAELLEKLTEKFPEQRGEITQERMQSNLRQLGRLGLLVA